MTKARERFHGVTWKPMRLFFCTVIVYCHFLKWHTLTKQQIQIQPCSPSSNKQSRSPFRDIINNQIVDIRVKNETVRFSHLQKCARIFEITAGKDKDENRNEEIIINLTQGNNKRPERDIYDRPWHQRSGNREKPWYNCRGQGEQRPSNQYTHNHRNRPFPEQPSASRNFSQGGNHNNSEFNQQYQPIHLNAPCPCCHRFGHTLENCRKLNRLCYRCGGPDHFARDCGVRTDKRNSLPGEQGSSVTRPRTRSMNLPSLNAQPPL